MRPQRLFPIYARLLALGCLLAAASARDAVAQEADTACRVEAVDYRGWAAQQLSNRWVRLIIVPQNGGRLMQVTFAQHDFLFVNPQFAGKYLPPSSTQWFNYGGDKLWLLPEGNDDEQHWVGNSDALDDGPYTFRKISEGQHCEIELVSPADPQTGIQFSRTIGLDTDSPRIRFRASMKNISGHTVEWSMQSVSQYATGAPGTPPPTESRHPGFHSGQPLQHLSQSVSRPNWPSRKSRRDRPG